MGDPVLVVAAHGDDEVLGAGGTIAAHVRAGDTVAVLILSMNDGSRPESDRHGEAARLASARAAQELLGVASLTLHELPDNGFDTVTRLAVARLVEAAVARTRPRLVYTHHGGDLSADHRTTYEAVMTATRPQPGHCVKEVLTFEIRSSTDWAFPGEGTLAFAPDTWVVLDRRAVELKMRALEAYSQELHPFPHSRSIEAARALLAHRGAQVGVTAAEAFSTVRRVLQHS